jgi:hypothetical protein
MRYIPSAEIPALPMNGVIHGECVAFGVFDPGFIIHFIERDKCILIGWEDAVSFGMELLKATPEKEEAVGDIEEIAEPTKVG